MPTHEEVQAAKAHLKLVDDSQELILEDMFDDLRSHHEFDLLDRENLNVQKN